MTLQFSFADFDDYVFDPKRLDNSAFRALFTQSGFVNSPETFAVIGLGGTMSSAYSPARENIQPTNLSPVIDSVRDLKTAFGIAESNISFLSLSDKDSRDITKDDIVFVLDVLNHLKNERIAVTCGTFGLPLLTKIIDMHFIGSGKTLGVTGSMLISSMRDHDADFNGGGVIASINAIHKFGTKPEFSNVFAVFHGNIYTPDECTNLDLHPRTHEGVSFYRGTRLVSVS